jgi:hypothetical protein
MESERDRYIRQALQLAQAGDNEQARRLLLDVLGQNRDDFDAWFALAQITQNSQEAISYVQQALRLRPEDDGASRYLDYLLQGEQDSHTPARTSPWLWGGLGAAFIALLLVAAIYVLSVQGSQPAAAQPADCAALIDQAIEVSDQGCQQLDRNQVCYGHSTVRAELVPGSNAQFDQPGNTIPVDILREFSASPYNQQKGEWGVGVFKLEANLPGTLPGQLVTLLAFGGTEIQNVSGDMQAFYFVSGLGGLQCNSVNLDGLLVRMPDGAGFVFRVNGTDVAVKGSSMLKAAANDSLSVTALSGAVKVGASGQEQMLDSGQTVTVPMGGTSGLDAVGPPSLPEPIDTTTAYAGCLLTGAECPQQPPPSLPAESGGAAVQDPVVMTASPDGSAGSTEPPTAEPMETVESTATQESTSIGTPRPTDSSKLAETPKLTTKEPKETKEPKPTAESKPTIEPKATKVADPTDVPKPTGEPLETVEPKPTDVPKPTDEPKETKEPKPTAVSPVDPLGPVADP